MSIDFPSGDELLAVCVDADRTHGAQRRRFRVSPNRRSGALVRHPGLHGAEGMTAGAMRCNRQDIEDLAHHGFLRLDRRNEPWEFDVTTDGFDRVDALRLAVAAPPVATVGPGLDWHEDVLPVIKASYDAAGTASAQLGPSQDDVNAILGRDSGSEATGRALIALVDAGYLQPTIETMGSLGPVHFRLTERALQITAGWPSGPADNLAAQLLAALDERIGHAEGDEKGRLERLRSGLADVGRDVLVAVLTDAVKRAGGDVF